ncbi:hypothetical protein [Saccharothrix syringae]|uniref:Thioesterase family protein n=1 Tax=Saccharothrix syringae TaxID=103733 RepID=A0A5Q0H736_SACSY|nr:hypothetical protein [Saccharothrix syringae]QFZ21650.1 hypothetical protein EKG83_33450 [Saccharothrix syringae]
MISESEVQVPARFTGAPDTAHGGYTCGLLATAAPPTGGTAVVSLVLPAPLEQPMRLETSPDQAVLVFGEELIATMVVSPEPIPAVPPVTALDADRAAENFLGRDDHPFPTCFVCGPDSVDGLLLTPGPLEPGLVACPWVPLDTAPEITWAVLDCAASWATDEPMALTRMAADPRTPPRPGERCVVVARQVQRVGPQATTLAALYAEDGALLATATAQWTALDV